MPFTVILLVKGAMYSFLPDELVKEILAPALQIPDSSFASTAKTSPFAKYQRSTSAYLLVCKDWLRVATPLLYNVVVLRSKAQIQALAWALKSTPQLARFIKKLRIECSYSAPLFNILQASIDLTDLCLSLEIYSQDSVTGICKGLPWVRPRRIIVYDPVKRTQAYNQNILSLVGMLVALIPEWTSLVRLLLYSNRSKLSFLINRFPSFSQTLQTGSLTLTPLSFVRSVKAGPCRKSDTRTRINPIFFN